MMEGDDIEAVVVSDANNHFITHYLAAHRLNGLISRVISNQSEIKDGALHVSAYHSHGCARNATPCAVNMCKGDIVTSLLKEKSYKAVWYLGDGSGDYCPAKILLEASQSGEVPLDVRIFCREGWSLHSRLREHLEAMDPEQRARVEPRIVPWGASGEGTEREHGDPRDYAALSRALGSVKRV